MPFFPVEERGREERRRKKKNGTRPPLFLSFSHSQLFSFLFSIQRSLLLSSLFFAHLFQLPTFCLLLYPCSRTRKTRISVCTPSSRGKKKQTRVCRDPPENEQTKKNITRLKKNDGVFFFKEKTSTRPSLFIFFLRPEKSRSASGAASMQ